MSPTDIAITLLLCSFAVMILLKVPVSFALCVSTIVTMLYLKIPMMTFVQQMAKSASSFSLLAIPFFVLAGEIMGAGGISDKILDFANIIVGRFRGGLALVNCLGSMIFGGMSGSAVADVSSVGAMLMPIMKKSGYKDDFTVALTVTTACQGVLIPPSHNMIFYAVAAGAGVSVGQLFLGGMIPGIMLGVAFMVYVSVIAKKENFPRGEKVPFKQALVTIRDAFLALLTPIIIIGGVCSGYFTATESSAIACAYSLVLSMFIYKKIKFRDLPRILTNVVNTLGMSFSLIATAGAFSWIMAYLEIPKRITMLLTSVTSSSTVLMLLILMMLLVLGCIMDMAPLILICTPILLPIVQSLGYTPVHFGIILVFALAIGLCTPPVGSALFVGCAVGKASVERVTKACLPLYLVMVTVLLIVTFVPAVATFLPNVLMGR